MPKASKFTIDDVRKKVGKVDVPVIDVATQGTRERPLDEFVEYFKKAPEERGKVLNVLSLEFSYTQLAKYVHGPRVLQKIDWARHAIPKQYWAASGRDLAFHPKVQK